MKDLDQTQIGQIPVERCGWPLAGFLDGMHREFQWHAAGIADTVANPAGKLHVVAIAGGQVRSRLRDADDRFSAAQFLGGNAVIHVALEIECRHCRIRGIVEPAPGPQALVFAAVMTGHDRVPPEGSVGQETVRRDVAGQACLWKGPPSG